MSKVGDSGVINKIRLSISVIISIAILLLSNAAYSIEFVNNDAAIKCAKITSRLERLSCFDNIFSPIRETSYYQKDIRPKVWFKANENELKRSEGNDLPLLSSSNNNSKDRWLTIPDNNNRKTILMMSCIDQISRIELISPQIISEARVHFLIDEVGKFTWRTDDSGYLLEGSRGIPAIDVMKKIMNLKILSIRSNLPSINGLEFNIVDLDLAPLRQSCRW